MKAHRFPAGSPVQAVALVLWCLAPQGIDSAQAQTVPALSADYVETVRLYASGDTNAALWQFGNWTEKRVSKHTADLSDAVVSIRKCPACPTRLAFSRFPVRAAVLLHADREIQQQFNPPESEQVPVCGAGPQAIMVEHLVSILLLVDPDAAPFAKRLYEGIARQAMWSHCFKEAADWARSGLKHFPRDPALLLAEGVAAEARAYFTLPPAPRTLGATPATLRKRERLSTELRDLRETARQSFEEALSADPDLAEARLRLGRTLWRLDRPGPARVALEAVLSKSAEASQQYLAHLFLGRILEDRDEFKGAEEHYQLALGMQPLSEIAAVAVSHIRFLQGDVEGARDRLSAGLDAVRKRRDYDPWMPYILPQTAEGEAILAELRRSISTR